MKNMIRAMYMRALSEGKSIAEATSIANGQTSEEAEAQAADIEMTDDELRAAIKAATGRAPHGRAKRPGLIEQYLALSEA